MPRKPHKKVIEAKSFSELREILGKKKELVGDDGRKYTVQDIAKFIASIDAIEGIMEETKTKIVIDAILNKDGSIITYITRAEGLRDTVQKLARQMRPENLK